MANKRQLVFDYKGQEASNKIEEGLLSNDPFMVARFGSTELSSMVVCKNSMDPFRHIKYAIGAFQYYRITLDAMSKLKTFSGVFPKEERIFREFYHQMVSDIQEIDILGSWREEERIFARQLGTTIRVPLRDLEPYYHERPWSIAFEGKKILVIHPFKKSIELQFEKRPHLFPRLEVLPDFELQTIKSVQSILNEQPDFEDWFAALDFMKDKIAEKDFDIAIIGCGAYGLPLAAHVKRMGKKAIHLGGATQLLFGIKGNRWKDHPQISKLFNEHWKHPEPEETIQEFKLIENGCYW